MMILKQIKKTLLHVHNYHCDLYISMLHVIIMSNEKYAWRIGKRQDYVYGNKEYSSTQQNKALVAS